MNFSTVPPCRSRTSRIASNQRPMIDRRDSGSSRWPRLVEPVTSAKTTVRTLRASRAGAAAASAVPHDMQNRAASGFGVPQVGQVTTMRSLESRVADEAVELPPGPRSGEAERRVERGEEAARERPELARVAEAGLGRELRPRRKRDGVGDPRVAPVGAVFDDDEAAAGLEVALHEPEDGELVALEVERVRHDDPVERRQVERLREVGDERGDRDVREARPQGVELNLERAPVSIDGVDAAARPEDVGAGESERTF